ncbi:unnamed protein product [Brachionus calyciflorus]|uniref:Uncharacterized protein n=1 Tax=Brachionus calyciflorus TaxID=104777 RepID=A0A813TV66_9BILA|nr:unnamed protein product [Brachionus calyciflorus]
MTFTRCNNRAKTRSQMTRHRESKNQEASSELPEKHIGNLSNLLINENFLLTCNESTSQVEKLIQDVNKNGFVITYFHQVKSFKTMKLTIDARRIQDTPNAGGSSIESEALSFEILKKFFNAELLKTEMEVVYFPEGGSITDYVIRIFNKVIGVSVTRAMKKNFELYTIEDADNLLRKKLKGILQSSRNSLVKWHKQILHVWAFDENCVDSLLIAWSELNYELKSNTVLIITVANKSKEVFVNQAPKIKKKKLIKNIF